MNETEQLVQKIHHLQQEIIKYKTSQPVLGDSGVFYKIVYNPGAFVSSSYSLVRQHTIRCVAIKNADNAVFVPKYQILPVLQSWLTELGSPLSSDFNIIYWIQAPITTAMQSNVGLNAFAPTSMEIISNVPFYIETSYVDRTS